MNPNDKDLPGVPQPEDFEEISKMLLPLQELQPPPETRKSNAMQISVELARLKQNARQLHKPLWRRTIAIPLPLVAVVALALVSLAILQIYESGNNAYNKPVIANSPALSKTPSSDNIPQQPSEAVSTTLPCEPLLYQEQTVVAGLGTIRSIQYYRCESETP